MDSQQLIQTLITLVVTHIPLLLVYFVGACLGVGIWKHHRRGSTLVVTGCLILLVHVIVAGTIAGLLPTMLQERGWSFEQITMLFNIFNFVRSVVSALGVGCLIAAALLLARALEKR